MREGSPFTGVGTIALKEAADHMTGARLHLIMLLVLLTAAGALYGAIGTIRAGATDDTFLFLKLFTTARQPVPSFAGLLGFLLPLVAIALGFDAINAEHGRRTMSRLLAQPIYRDAILFGKFLGGLLVIAVAMVTLWLGTTGLGILFLGLPPTGAEVLRGLAYLVATIAYAGVWLALAMTLSTVIRSTATSALAALSIWLVLSVFWGMIAPVVASAISPVDPLNPMSLIDAFQTQQAVARLSPQTLYGEITAILLDPAARSVGPLFIDQLRGALLGAPLPTIESLAIVWPQMSGLIAAMILLFTAAYVLFQRQEIRA
ncbi:MAG: ABC transporter permease [Tistrella sp.]|mgnify:CR=1 FL=1|uniref:ABC transporter permease protein n=4 Tax=Tistrella mobilis TaxID=171437 RepID=I3TJY4_TISMK|nr:MULTISPECIES: ABC transporter permease [Tistrella]AFK53072.1 ABC transporter permease protein [Tistrella mobilis KA081020-065]KYO52729.1 ABC transporter permease [Tistrella mobilis]MAD40114.1 ABC transporter permease [Tistrella sp.]MAM74063.1 ABC transporter permease [Tistrella sp.]MBA77301.1 ABC transporter permease [Tistrella sp.]